METSLIKIESFVAIQKAGVLREVINENFGEQGISIFNFERVRLPGAGSTNFIIVDSNGDQSEIKDITAIMPYKKEERNFWMQDYSESSGNAPPNCHSDDLKMGIGDNGQGTGEHLCKTCPQNSWVSTPKGGVRRPCRMTSLFFLLREGREKHIFPSLMSVAPGSAKSIAGYLTGLSSEGIIYRNCLHNFSLEKAKSRTGIIYSQIKCRMVRELDELEKEKLRDYAITLKASFAHISAAEADAHFEPPEDE